MEDKSAKNMALLSGAFGGGVTGLTAGVFTLIPLSYKGKMKGSTIGYSLGMGAFVGTLMGLLVSAGVIKLYGINPIVQQLPDTSISGVRYLI